MFFLGKNNAESIIMILGEEWPLSAKQVYSRARRTGAIFSYKQTHKLLSELSGKGIIVRRERLYFLNRKWVAEKRQEFEFLEHKLGARQSIPRFVEPGMLAEPGQTRLEQYPNRQLSPKSPVLEKNPLFC